MKIYSITGTLCEYMNSIKPVVYFMHNMLPLVTKSMSAENDEEREQLDMYVDVLETLNNAITKTRALTKRAKQSEPVHRDRVWVFDANGNPHEASEEEKRRVNATIATAYDLTPSNNRASAELSED